MDTDKARESTKKFALDPSDRHRKKALGELGKALALNPDDKDVRKALHEVLAKPPKNIPEEVGMKTQAVQAERRRRISRIAGLAYLSIFATLGLTGVVPSSYAFADGVLSIRPIAITHTSSGSITIMAIGALAILGANTFMATFLYRLVRRAEREPLVRTWQLRQLLP